MIVKRKPISFFLVAALVLVMLFSFGDKSSALEIADGKLKINGFLKNQTAYRLGAYGGERGDGLAMFRNTLQLEAEIKFSESIDFVVINRSVWEPAYDLEDAAVAAGNFEDDIFNETEFREWYLTFQATDKLWFAFGKQQVVWGDLGGVGVRVMDTINAGDFRWHYTLEAWEDIRKPLIMFNTIYSMPQIDANLQLVWVPGLEDTWHRVHSIYTNPGHRYGINNVVDPTKPPNYFIPGVAENDKGDAPGIERKLEDSTIAVRFQKMSGELTWAISNVYTFNHSPSVWVDASGLNIQHLRQNIFGVSVNWYDKYTDGVWSFEAGHFHNMPYTGNLFQLVETDTYQYGVQYEKFMFFDWLRDGSRSLYAAIQVFGTYIPDTDDIANDNSDQMWALYLSTGFFNDRVKPSIYPAYNFDREFGMCKIWVDWRPQMFGGDFQISPVLWLLYGETDTAGDFGLVRGCTEALLELKYEF